MNRMTLIAPLLLAGALLTGCATPYDIGAADRGVTPHAAAQDIATVQNRVVAWGGAIVAAKNLKDNTQMEVVGYPLDSENRPDRDAAPIGRFLVIQAGYLETADYAPGRLITVVGTVTGTRSGTVGDAQYVYPVVAASKLKLWPRPPGARPEPSFHFGVGIGIIR